MRQRHLRILGPESRDVLHDVADSGYRRVGGLDNAWGIVSKMQIGAQFGCIVSKMHGAVVLEAPLHENKI